MGLVKTSADRVVASTSSEKHGATSQLLPPVKTAYNFEETRRTIIAVPAESKNEAHPMIIAPTAEVTAGILCKINICEQKTKKVGNARIESGHNRNNAFGTISQNTATAKQEPYICMKNTS